MTPPEPLADHHDLSAFSSGVALLDNWLRRRARANQASGASRTYVVADGPTVSGYYALAPGAVASTHAAGRVRRNMPDPIPVVVLGRLAVHRDRQRQGLGQALFRDAALRVIQAADLVGVRALLVHAISAEARDFYLALGLEASPIEEMTLMATLADLRAAASL